MQFLFDKHFDIRPNAYIQPCFFKYLVKHVLTTGSYESLKKIFGHEFSTTQVTKIMKAVDFHLALKPIRTQTKLLFINADDIYVLRHKDTKACVRTLVAYTGTEIANGRQRLVERTVLSIDTTLTSSQQADEIERVINEVYGIVDKVVLVGDGAAWISSLALNFVNNDIERYIDKFHYKK